MKIEHSKQINDFIMFFIETKIDGKLIYETAIDYYHLTFSITNLITRKEYRFDFHTENEEKVIEQIKYEVEKLANEDFNENTETELSITNIESQIKSTTTELLEMAKNHSWNKISENVTYLIKEVDLKIYNDSDLFEINKIRKKILQSKKQLNLEQAVQVLKLNFKNIHLIELHIFQSKKELTIIEIEVLEKSSLDEEYKKTVFKDKPMLHCKVFIPPYIGLDQKEKFDINWQLETIQYKWKMFWWKLKRKKYERKVNVA